jgi:hypothetical protein
MAESLQSGTAGGLCCRSIGVPTTRWKRRKPIYDDLIEHELQRRAVRRCLGPTGGGRIAGQLRRVGSVVPVSTVLG